MSWMTREAHAGVRGERRGYTRLSIGTRLALWFTLSAFAMLAVVTVFQYRMLVRGLEWDETRLVLDKIMMFEATLREHGDDPIFLDHEVNLEGGAYWTGQHYIIYSRILDEAGGVIIETPGMARLIPPAVFPAPVEPVQALIQNTVHYREAPNGRAYFLHSAMAGSGGADGPGA